MTTDDLLNDSKLIIDTFDVPEITNSAVANDFYDLKSTLSMHLLDSNKDLPNIKQQTLNAKLPSELLKQRFGSSVDSFNNNIHPLFSDEQVNHVS